MAGMVMEHGREVKRALNDAGTPFTRHVFKRKLERLCRRAELGRIYSPYSLRHTFASMESDAGMESNGLSRLMGHSTTRTLERYVSNTSEYLKKGVDALQNRIRALTEGGGT